MIKATSNILTTSINLLKLEAYTQQLDSILILCALIDICRHAHIIYQRLDLYHGQPCLEICTHITFPWFI